MLLKVIEQVRCWAGTRIQIQPLSSSAGPVALEEGGASALLWLLLGGKWAGAVRGPGCPFELPFFCTWCISDSGSSTCLLCHGVLVPTIGSLILGWHGRWQKGPSSGKNGLDRKAISCHLLAGFRLPANSSWSLNLAFITVTLKSQISIQGAPTALLPLEPHPFPLPHVFLTRCVNPAHAIIPNPGSMKRVPARAGLNPKGLSTNGK